MKKGFCQSFAWFNISFLCAWEVSTHQDKLVPCSLVNLLDVHPSWVSCCGLIRIHLYWLKIRTFFILRQNKLSNFYVATLQSCSCSYVGKVSIQLHKLATFLIRCVDMDHLTLQIPCQRCNQRASATTSVWHARIVIVTLGCGGCPKN